MHPTILAAFLEISGTAVAMCTAGIALFVIGIWAAKNDIAQARGLDKIVALSNLSFAVRWRSSARYISSARNSSKTLCRDTCPGVCSGYILLAAR